MEVPTPGAVLSNHASIPSLTMATPILRDIPVSMEQLVPKKESTDESVFMYNVNTILSSFYGEYYENLHNSNVANRLIFPKKLSSEQRRCVHYVAQSLGLEARSYGSPPNRYITVSFGNIVGSSFLTSNLSLLPTPSNQWTIDKAREWYSSLPWLVGCNYIPSTAVNQLEMWQAETFDFETIVKEIMLAKSLGFNVFRVYLHDLLWNPTHRTDFLYRIDLFLSIANSYGIMVIFVLFDDCHRTKNIKLGEQPLPIKGVHNSGWVQSPGSAIVESFYFKSNYRKDRNRLQQYVCGVLSYFRDDERILMWDLYNEPGQNNLNFKSSGLLTDVWNWAYSVRPSQPLTSCLDGSVGDENIQINRHYSDIITFHWYQGHSLLGKIQHHIHNNQGRPVICTEYMAREFGTTFQFSLPLFKCHNVGAISWGLVAGKTQTIFNWETVKNIEKYRSYGRYLNYPAQSIPEPIHSPWFHDIYRVDGTPYDEEEVKFIRSITGVADIVS